MNCGRVITRAVTGPGAPAIVETLKERREMRIGFTKHLTVTICEDSEDAFAKGHTYEAEKGFRAVTIESAVVVVHGTGQGNPTVDLVMVDAEGNKYVTMISGNLLRTIPV